MNEWGLTDEQANSRGTLRELIAAKIHQAYTVTCDQLSQRGYLSQDQRKKLSALMGEVLKVWNMRIPEEIASLEIDQTDLSAIASKEVSTAPDGSAQTGVSVFKNADGKWIWVLFSSSAFEDNDGEIVSLKALANDAERMTNTGEYGTLDWWHCDGKYHSALKEVTPPLILGNCFFSAMHGRVRVEAGTFVEEWLGECFAAKEHDLGVSLRFTFDPKQDLDRNGVFHAIKTTSRALMPRGKESNLLTRLYVAKEENTMVKERIDALVQLLGGGERAKQIVDKMLDEAQSAEQVAAAAGLKSKETTAPETPAAETPLVPNTAAANATPAAATPPNAEAAKDKGMYDEASPSVEQIVNELTRNEMISLISQAVYPQIEKAMAEWMGKALVAGASAAADDSASKETQALHAALRKWQQSLNGTTQLLTGVQSKQEEFETRLKELEGNLPASLRGVRPSEDAANTVQRNKEQNPAASTNASANPWLDLASRLDGTQPVAPQ